MNDRSGSSSEDAGAARDGYSIGFAAVFIFNLIVGFGTLALPAVFHDAGYLLSPVILSLVGFVSFVTSTFVTEALAAGNAILLLDQVENLNWRTNGCGGEGIEPRSVDSDEFDRFDRAETAPLCRNDGAGNDAAAGSVNVELSNSSSSSARSISSVESHDSSVEADIMAEHTQWFDIRLKLEISDLAEIFLGSFGLKLLSIVFALYLYGDLAIYATVTPTTLVNVFPGDMKEIDIPWISSTPIPLSRDLAYYFWLVLFAGAVVPLSCFNIPNTKYLQLVTCTYRNFSLVVMLALALIRYSTFEKTAAEPDFQSLNPPAFAIEKLPKLFGSAIYSFMCHHSLPGLIYYVRGDNKEKAYQILAVDFSVVLMFYILLCSTAILAFGLWRDSSCDESADALSCKIQDIYILNFGPSDYPFLGELLFTFPVYVSLTSYPLIAITTRNNLYQWFDIFKAKLFHPKRSLVQTDESTSSLNGVGTEGRNLIDVNTNNPKVWHSLLVACPPIVVAAVLHNSSDIVAFTGNYAGLGVAYIFPAWIVYASRKAIKERFKGRLTPKNPYKSPFQSNYWVAMVGVWVLLALVFVVTKQILEALK